LEIVNTPGSCFLRVVGVIFQYYCVRRVSWPLLPTAYCGPRAYCGRILFLFFRRMIDIDGLSRMISLSIVQEISRTRKADAVRARRQGRLAARYLVEFARSNRSHCRVCGGGIGVGTLRVAALESASTSDGERYEWKKWRHLRCFFDEYSRSSEVLPINRILNFHLLSLF